MTDERTKKEILEDSLAEMQRAFDWLTIYCPEAQKFTASIKQFERASDDMRRVLRTLEID